MDEGLAPDAPLSAGVPEQADVILPQKMRGGDG
jgi:hypothetical protein